MNIIKISDYKNKEKTADRFKFNNGKVLLEVILSLGDKNKEFNLENLYMLILNNLESSSEYQEKYNTLKEEKKNNELNLLKEEIRLFLEEIYKEGKPTKLLSNIVEEAEIYYYNYKYGI